MSERFFHSCEKCGSEVSVSHHRGERATDCMPLGSDDPCWDFHWREEEHFSLRCRRCGYRRVEHVVAPEIEAVTNVT